ncbi:MAG: amidohydrolase family protein [Desulfovibrio sp.]|nr:amidohydrolase family protein [Desulfovibrio sp.]
MNTIIDTHNHLWTLDEKHFSWIPEGCAIHRDFSITDLKEVLSASGVSGSILVQAVPTLDETLWLLGIAEDEPVVRGVIGWANVAAGSAVAADLETLARRSAKLKGIRYMSQGLPPEHLTEQDFIAGVRTVGRHGLVYELLITASQLEAAETLIAACPDVAFVIEHIAKPDIRNRVLLPWRNTLTRIARAHGNVSCKLSGMVTEADHQNWSYGDIEPYMATVFEAFGPDRVLYGSDWPVSLLAAQYKSVLGLCAEYVAAKPAAEQDKFFALNAKHVYGLADG